MPIILASRAVRALCLRSRTTWVQNQRLVNSAGRSFRLFSTDNGTSHTATPRLKKVYLTPYTPAKFINNLAPHSINPEDYIDLSGRYDFRGYFHQEDIGTPNFTRLLPSDSGRSRFPAGCRGFFYFYEDPGGRFNASGIRFRIAQEPTQRAFDAGEDYGLCGFNKPWSRSLWQLAGSSQPGYSSILQRLYQDGLVDPDNVAKWSRILETSGLFVGGKCPPPERLLMSLDEPFEFEMSSKNLRFYVLQPRLARIALYVFLSHEGKMPYTGRCVIRLEKVDEKSTPSGKTYATVNIRVLKTLTPIECAIPGYEGILPPKAGSLLQNRKGPVKRSIVMISTNKLSPDAIAEKMRSKFTPALPGRQISTLDSERLTSDDHLDFSGIARVKSIWTSAKAVRTTGVGLQEYAASVSNRVPVPTIASLNKQAAGKQGFLYFHQSHPQNPLSGSIRFRLAEQPTIDSFHQGEDLIHPLTESAWELPLLRLINARHVQPLVEQLLQDGLVTPETVDACKRLLLLYPRIPNLASVVLYELDQPFVMDLSQDSQTVYYMNSNQCRIWQLCQNGINSGKPYFKYSFPYTGRCLVSLEEVTTVTPSGSSRHIMSVQIRLLKILEPLGWRNPTQPQGELPTEGSLLPIRGWEGKPADLAYLVAAPKLGSTNHEVASCG